jgi:hypothetical protein
MKLNIGMMFAVNLGSKERFLDELILSTKDLFQQEATGKFLGFILEAVDKDLCDTLVRAGVEDVGISGATDSPEVNDAISSLLSCCKAPRLRRYRREKKKIMTAVGSVRYEWNRLRCKNCKTTVVPMRAILALKKYQSESFEFQKLACETVVQQSFRRSCKHLSQIGGIRIDRMKLHRILCRAQADEIDANVRGKGVQYLIADGTGFPEWKPTKTQADEAAETIVVDTAKAKKTSKVKERKSDLKVVIGLTAKHEMIPVGVWAKRSWKHVGEVVKKANNHPKLKPKPIADILLCDGEEALINAMGPLAREIQRCQWHLTYEFFHLMKYQEKCETELSRALTDKLYDAVKLGIPETNDLEAKLKLKTLIFESEKALDKVINELKERGHYIAATYVENAKGKLFTFLRYWIQTGEVAPKVTSRIERLMRELGRRVKKIGFNWSAKGAARITRILLKILAANDLWENEWKKKLNLKNTVSLSLKGVYSMACVPTNL